MCPYYKNKQVFNEFNEIIQAFGGKPMTEDEFKSGSLRNERSGQDLIAMEVAYYLWDKNNGNSLDYAPNGKKSRLFSDLLKTEGSRKQAILKKSKVFTDEFINWFGDWMNDSKEASKVVDENGEPLIVYHGTTRKLFKTGVFNKDTSRINDYDVLSIAMLFENKLSKNAIKQFKSDMLYFDGYYFTTDFGYANAYASRYSDGITIPVFLNIKNIKNMNDSEVNKESDPYGDYINHQSVIVQRMLDYDNQQYDGMVGDEEGAVSYVVFDENQIKSIYNNGNFSTEEKSILAQKTVTYNFLHNTTSEEAFGKENKKALESGNSVSSSSIVEHMLNNDMFGYNTELANIIQKHDIPVSYGETDLDILAVTVTDKNGESVVVINKNAISSVSIDYLSTAILHEIIHAITTNAINNPKTSEEKILQNYNHKAFEILNRIFKDYKYSRHNFDQGFYALSNENEFSAIFMTDQNVRDTFYQEAKKFDNKTFNRIKNVLTNLINSFTKMLLNREFFKKSAVEQLSQYEHVIKNYVYNATTISSKNFSNKELKQLYQEIDGPLAFNQKMQMTAKALNASLNTYSINAQHEEAKQIASYEEISKKLSTKLLSIRSSNLSADEKSLQIESTKNSIELLNSANVAKYTAISNIVKKTGPYILSQLRQIRDNKNMSDKDLRFKLHSDFATYQTVFNDLAILIKNTEDKHKLINEYNSLVTNPSEQITMNDIDRLISQLDDLVQNCKDGKEILEVYRKNRVIDVLSKEGEQSKSPTIDKYIDIMYSLKQERPTDMLSFEASFGAADAVNDETVRLLAHIVKKATDTANDRSIEKAADLLELQKKLKSKSEIQKLYELDDHKKTTGYLVRQRKYGVFYNDYDKFLVQLNKKISEKYNIPIAADNRVAPDEKEARIAWQKARNEWLDLNCDRQYTKEYYDAWAEVSQETRTAMRDINNLIYSMTHRVDILDPDTKIPRYENFTDEEFETLQSLFERKRLLRSFYDENGNKKQEGTPEWQIAYELDNLNKKLYAGQKLSKNKKEWSKARDIVIERCGGKEEYNKWLHNQPSTFNEKEFQKWESRNTKWEFITDDEDQAYIFQEIEREMQGIKPYYGSRYEEISKQINQMLAPFYKQNGEINSSNISEALKSNIKKLLKEQREIKRKVSKNNPQLIELSKKYGAIFNKYIEFEDTQEFKNIKRDLISTAQGDPFLYDMMIGVYGTSFFDFNLGISTNFRPYRWYQKMSAKEKLKYMEPRPGDAWIDRTNNEKYVNDDFDETQDTTFVPRLQRKQQDLNGFLNTELGIVLKNQKDTKRYDNTSVYNYVTNNGTMEGTAIAEYYNAIKQTIKESNALQTNRPVVDDYLLPQVVGSLYKRMKNHPWRGDDSKWSVFKQYVKELFGVQNENDKEVFGTENTLSETDQLGGEEQSKYNPYVDTYSASMPDGSPYRALPQFYTRKLKDPSQLSSDLTGIVLDYYNMSQKYHERSKIADQCELMMDELKNTTLRVNRFTNRIVGKDQGESNTYKMAREWLDANLYDIRKISKVHWGTNWTKFVSNLSRWTTSTNLGLNPKVAIVGMLTTGWTHVINAITGQKYNKMQATKAGFITIYHIGKNLFGLNLINDNLTNDKQMLIMEMCNVSNQFSKKYKNTHRNRIAEALNRNWIFGMMSTCDYIMKSQITTSVMLSYHYVNGEFVTKDDIRMNLYKYGGSYKQNKKRLFEEWEKGPSLYSVLSSQNHRLVCQDQYKDAFEKVRHVVINRAQKYCEHADGMATEEQKALISRGIIGSLLLIHRQYLPLMIQERTGHTVYDYDTQQMKNGQFRRLIKFIASLMLSNKYIASAAGASVGFMSPAGLIGALIGGALVYKGAKKAQQKGLAKKSISETIKSSFFDYSTQEANIESQMNRYAFKQISAELVLYNIILSTIVNMVCFYADEPENKDKKLLQAIAYWLRGFQWEAFTPYRFNDILSNFKSPTAVLSHVDRVLALTNSVNTSLTDDPLIWLLSLCGSPIFDTEYSESIKRGTYKGYSKTFKNTIKTTPVKNIFEQYVDSKAKRKYAENQLYDINKKEQQKSFDYLMYQKLMNDKKNQVGR